MGSILDCRLISLPVISDPRGSLAVVEGNVQIPFNIQRVYYLFDIPGGSDRGGHAHKSLEQLIICLSGSLDITIDDGKHVKVFTLNRSYEGLYLCPYIWRSLSNFSSGAVCLVLASQVYDESDYIRSYEEFAKCRE